MQSDIFTDTLRAFCRRRPFKPFLVELTSGQHIIVEHPEALAFVDGTAVHVSPRHEISMFDNEGVTRLHDITIPQPTVA